MGYTFIIRKISLSGSKDKFLAMRLWSSALKENPNLFRFFHWFFLTAENRRSRVYAERIKCFLPTTISATHPVLSRHSIILLHTHAVPFPFLQIRIISRHTILLIWCADANVIALTGLNSMRWCKNASIHPCSKHWRISFSIVTCTIWMFHLAWDGT